MPRPNVNGRAYKYRQTKAPVVELIGQRDVANLSAADALKDTYVGMIGSLYQISQQGITQPGYWVVLDADVTRITKLVIGLGGLASGSVWIECRFAVTKAE